MTKPRVSSLGTWALGIMLLVGIGLVCSFRTATPPVPTEEASTTAPPAPQEAPIGWPLVDLLWRERSHYRDALGDVRIPEWSNYTHAYFQELKRRRDAVIAWSVSQAQPPGITFVGIMHTNLAGGNTADSERDVERIQAAAFEQLRLRARDTQVIAIEQSGSDAVVTQDVYVQVTRDSLRTLNGATVSDAVILGLMRQDRQAATRAIIELASTPVICGEEWPLMFQTRMLMAGAPQDPARYATQYALMDGLNRLRSEIALIRTLEYLRRTQGRRGIILQGDMHREHVQALAPEYHIAFLGIAPN